MRFSTWLAAMVLASPLGAQERIMLDAKINGHPIHLALDTGGGAPVCIFSPAAEKLGLKVFPPPAGTRAAPGAFLLETTKPLIFEMFNRVHGPEIMGVMDVSPSIANLLDVDGFVGFPFFKSGCLRINWRKSDIDFLVTMPSMEDLSRRLNRDKNWIRLRVHRTPGVRSLVLELPSSRGSDPDLLLIDTGAENGVSLSEKRWREWTQSQPANSPATIEGYQNLQEKVVGEEYLARTLKLDDFVLYNVPVVKAAPLVALGLGPRYAATLGLEALKQVDLVIDCEHGLAYVSSYAERGPWNYNRLGAVFFPADDQDHRLVARVSAQGPAALAGIHLGDELVKVNDLDLAALSAKGIPADSYWRKPAGTKLVLTLRRGGTMFSVTVVLQEIFARDSDLPKRGL